MFDLGQRVIQADDLWLGTGENSQFNYNFYWYLNQVSMAL